MKNTRLDLFGALALFFVVMLAASGASSAPGRSIVPLTLTQGAYGGGRIYVSVRFGDVLGTLRLDSGASTTRIALAPWNKDLPPVGQSASTGASGKTNLCEDVEADRVSLKAAEGNSIARAKYIVSRCADGDDLLGLDFFKGARFTIDFDRREMVFFGDAQADARPKSFRTLGPDRRLVGIDLRLGDATTIGLFDTGAEISAVDRWFADSHKNLFKLVKGKAGAGVAGGARMSAKLYKIKQLDLGGGSVLRGVYAFVYDFGPLREALGRQTPVILGYNVLSAFKWRLDFTAPNAPTWDAAP